MGAFVNLITSTSNNRVKEIKSLKDKKFRNENGLYFIEGIRFFEEAIIEYSKKNIEIVDVVISEDFDENLLRSILQKYSYNKLISVTKVSSKNFYEMSDTKTPQGILAVIKMKKYDLVDIIDKGELFIFIDSIQDPGNLGTIVRTAEAAGFDGIIASKGTVDLYNNKVLRSTMGSVFRIPFILSENVKEDMKKMKENGVKIYGAHLNADKNIYQHQYTGKIALVLGNEGAGMSDLVMHECNELLIIPMQGNAESLNVSVASAVLMFEVVRQRRFI